MTSESQKGQRKRGQRKTVTGKVLSDKMDKTITVVDERVVKHPRYKKYVKRGTRYKAHDEQNQAREGDVVEIAQCRPLSKTKTRRLVRVIRTNRLAEASAEGGDA